ncbi:MAG: NAD(+) diphosphatase [Bacillota bacterium]|nr:NAD(+) diphosphatase [Bacillota bacterium]
MIHQIAPHQFDNSFSLARPADTDIALLYRGNTVLMTGDRLPTVGELRQAAALPLHEYRYLFAIDEQRFFLCADSGAGPPPAGWSFQDTLQFRTYQPQHLAFAGITGLQLYRWYSAHQYCGRCGKPMSDSLAERARVCADCGMIEYPKIAPAIIVAVTDGERLLMAKNKRSTYKRFALIAGFLEIGETLEQAVAREVFEETGLHIRNIRYYQSQPWAFSDTIMIGFFAELDGDSKPQMLDGELSELRWFNRDEIPENPTMASISQELIEQVRAGRHRQWLDK